MIEEHDVIIAKHDISEEIVKGTHGVILSVYDNGNFFLVEFFDDKNETIDNGMTTVSKNQIELLIKV